MPDDPVVRFGLAGAYLDAGQAESAIVEYQETIRLKPDYSAAHRGLGRALERAGRREEARARGGGAGRRPADEEGDRGLPPSSGHRRRLTGADLEERQVALNLPVG